MRVIFDQLYNHSSDESPLLDIDRDYWYYPDRHYPDDPDNYWGPEFNYSHYDENRETFPARDFMGEVVRFWIQKYHIDGIRYDALRQLDNWDFLSWMTHIATQTAGSKPFYNIGEHMGDSGSSFSLQCARRVVKRRRDETVRAFSALYFWGLGADCGGFWNCCPCGLFTVQSFLR